MKFRSLALLVALPAMIGGLLVGSPAQAAGKYNVSLDSRAISISTSGNGKVLITCRNRHTCKGKLSFKGDTAKTRVRRYRVKPGKSAWVAVAMHTNAPTYPYNGTSVGGEYKYKRGFLYVNEDSPKNITHRYSVTTETPVTKQRLSGRIYANYPAGSTTARMSNLRVELIRTERGGNTKVLVSRKVSEGGTYSINVALRANNAPSEKLQLMIKGIDKDGQARSWFWRGTNGNPAGGGRYLREASTIQLRKNTDFKADFHYTSIHGTTNYAGSQIRVAALPATGLTTRLALREFDLTGCANVYGATTAAGGKYQVDFLPFDNGRGDRRYMVNGKYRNTQTWNNTYGSCQDVLNYRYSRSNLLALGAGGLAYNVSIHQSRNTVHVNGAYRGFRPTSADKWVRLREKVPGVPILDAPVVAEGYGNSKGNRTFKDVPPGKYWVEIGRRTSCSSWIPSKYSNNKAYLSGLDRHAEAWKTVAGRNEEFKRSVVMGYKRKTPPRGYKGWMYREYCKAYGAGTVNTVNVRGFNSTQMVHARTDRKGAVVKGHVSRAGGKTNKEILVRLSSSRGTRVVRTDVTDSRGNFYIAGLPSGNWTISVNSDSWRGIGRKFTGRHSVRVRAGHGYNVHTLHFKG